MTATSLQEVKFDPLVFVFFAAQNGQSDCFEKELDSLVGLAILFPLIDAVEEEVLWSWAVHLQWPFRKKTG